MITSFGHKHGSAPASAKKTFDVRTLTHDESHADFKKQAATIAEWARTHPGCDFAIGCEQGQHRSVVLAKSVGKQLRTSVYHRDNRKPSVTVK